MERLQILKLADPKALARMVARSNHPLGTLMQRVVSSASPDEEFTAGAKVMLRGFTIAKRRLQIQKLSVALGIDRPLLKKYLKFHGLVNEKD